MKSYKGRGYWSVMDCLETEPHEPHVWNSEYCFYGPYKCERFPETPEYEGRHRA